MGQSARMDLCRRERCGRQRGQLALRVGAAERADPSWLEERQYPIRSRSRNRRLSRQERRTRSERPVCQVARWPRVVQRWFRSKLEPRQISGPINWDSCELVTGGLQEGPCYSQCTSTP